MSSPSFPSHSLFLIFFRFPSSPLVFFSSPSLSYSLSSSSLLFWFAQICIRGMKCRSVDCVTMLCIKMYVSPPPTPSPTVRSCQPRCQQKGFHIIRNCDYRCRLKWRFGIYRPVELLFQGRNNWKFRVSSLSTFRMENMHSRCGIVRVLHLPKGTPQQ